MLNISGFACVFRAVFVEIQNPHLQSLNCSMDKHFFLVHFPKFPKTRVICCIAVSVRQKLTLQALHTPIVRLSLSNLLMKFSKKSNGKLLASLRIVQDDRGSPTLSLLIMNFNLLCLLSAWDQSQSYDSQTIDSIKIINWIWNQLILFYLVSCIQWSLVVGSLESEHALLQLKRTWSNYSCTLLLPLKDLASCCTVLVGISWFDRFEVHSYDWMVVDGI